jgi:TPR repeat protein
MESMRKTKKIELTENAMSFRKCPDCETPLSSNAKSCKVCGADLREFGPQRDPSNTTREVMFLVGLICMVGFIGLTAAYLVFDQVGSAPKSDLAEAPPEEILEPQSPVAPPVPEQPAHPTYPTAGMPPPAPAEPNLPLQEPSAGPETPVEDPAVTAKAAPAVEPEPEAPPLSEGEQLYVRAQELEREALRKAGKDETRKIMQDAVHSYRASAAKNHGPALYRLGELYQQGTRVPRNPKKAFRLFLKAGESGVVPAQVAAALMVIDGDFSVDDCPDCMSWLRNAADRGHGAAQLEMGRLTLRGDIPATDPIEEALDWFQSAANGGYSEALSEIGTILMTREDVAPDIEGAYHNFLRASRDGHVDGLRSLVRWLEDIVQAEMDDVKPPLLPGDVVKIRKNSGLVINGKIKEATPSGILINEDGGGETLVSFEDLDVDSRTRLDREFRKVLAQIRLEEILTELGAGVGDIGASQALRSVGLRSAGTPEDLRDTGLSYMDSPSGQNDYALAFLYLRLAARGGDSVAQYNLAKLYYDGLGVDADESLGLAWAKKSSQSGYGPAREFIRKDSRKYANAYRRQEIAMRDLKRERDAHGEALLQYGSDLNYITFFEFGKGSKDVGTDSSYPAR